MVGVPVKPATLAHSQAARRAASMRCAGRTAMVPVKSSASPIRTRSAIVCANGRVPMTARRGKGKRLTIGIAGLGAIGMDVAKRLAAGIPGLKLAAVSARDAKAAAARLKAAGIKASVVALPELARRADIVVECLPAAQFRTVAEAAIKRRRVFMPLSVGALLANFDLVERAKKTGARIIVPTGALIGLDGAPYLAARGISLAGLAAPKKVFEGSARDGA